MMSHYSSILNRLLQLYCVLLPFEEAFAGSFGSVVKLVGLAIIAYIIAAYRKISISKNNFLLLAWLALGLISVGWADSFDWWRTFFTIYISQILFVTVVSGTPTGKIDLSSIRKGLILGTVIVTLLLTCFPQNFSLTAEGRRSIILFGRAFDPNILAGVIMLGVFSAFQELFLSTKKLKRWGMFAVILFGILGIFYTGSRGGLISCVIGIALALFLEFRTRKNRKIARRFVALGTIAVLFIIPHLSTNILEGRYSVHTIFGLNEVETGAHNRYFIWASALKLIPQKPILGYGIGNFIPAMGAVYTRFAAAHNIFMLVIVETGLIGLILIGLFLYRLMRGLYKKKSYVTIGLMTGVLILSMTLDALPYKFFWVAVLYVELVLRQTTTDIISRYKN